MKTNSIRKISTYIWDQVPMTPNVLYPIYAGPYGITHLQPGHEKRNPDYQILLHFNIYDEAPKSFAAVLSSVTFQMSTQQSK